MQTSIRITFIATFLAVSALLACGGPSTDSETHWAENDGEENQTENNQNQTNNHNQNGSNHNGINQSHNQYENQSENHHNGSNSYEPWGLEASLAEIFGEVPVGEEKTVALQIINHDEETISITDLYLDAQDFSFEPALDDWPTEIAGEDSFEVDVTFAPTEARERRGWLTILWEDQSNYEEETLLFLRANSACLEASPTNLEFTDLAPGDSETRTVTVTNCAGVAQLEITPEVRHASSDQHQPFSLANEAAFPQVLTAGATTEVEVEYAPTQSTWQQAYLDILTDATVSRTVYLLNENEQVIHNDDPGPGGQNDRANDYNGGVNDWNGGEGVNDGE